MQTIRQLYTAGKLHKKLVFRVRIIMGISVVFGLLTLYDILWKGVPILPAIVFATAGYLCGFYIFSRMNKITWNEEAEEVQLKKFDTAGIIILLLYLSIRLSDKLFIARFFTNVNVISGIAIAAAFGMAFGRCMGTIREIKRAHLSSME